MVTLGAASLRRRARAVGRDDVFGGRQPGITSALSQPSTVLHRLAARCHDVDVCRTSEDGHGEGGDSLDDVLAIVEHQHQSAIPERTDQARNRISRLSFLVYRYLGSLFVKERIGTAKTRWCAKNGWTAESRGARQHRANLGQYLCRASGAAVQAGEEVKFAADSLLEGGGFEPSVPLVAKPVVS